LKNPRNNTVKTFIIVAVILATTLLQVSPAAGLDSYQRLDRVGDSLTQGVAETTIPYIDSDDGYFYVVRGSPTGTVPRSPLATPSSYNINSGTLLGTDSLSNLSSSDDVYWNARSSPSAINAYYPSSYNLIDSTKLKSGSLSEVNANDSQYMSFESYGQYALNFTGSYYVDAGSAASLDITGSFTIEFRMKWTSRPSSGTENHDIVSKYGGGYGYRVYFTMDQYGSVNLYGRVRSSSYEVSTSFTPTLGTWYHVAFVNNNGYLYLYLNGNRQSSRSATNPGSTTSSFRIGESESPFNAKYSVDELAVWKVAKWTGSSFQVPTTPYTGTESNLAGLWHMNDGYGTTVKDSSPNSNQGTATSTPVWVSGQFGSTKNVEVEFSGIGNTVPFLGNLTWMTDLSVNASSVSITVQLFNYTLRDFPTSGNGFLTYTSSATPNVDETKTQTITINPNHFRNSTTGAWRIKITGKLTTGHFALNADLVGYSTFNKAATDLEFVSTLSDYSNIRPALSALNVTIEVRCNVTSAVYNLYLYNYSRSAYVLKDTFAVSMTDVKRSVSVASRMADYVSSATGEMKIKLNSTYAATYVGSIDLIQWALKYNEPKWEIQWRVDYKTAIPRTDITKLSVRMKANLSRTADIAHLSIYNYSSSSWTPVANENYTSMLTRWYNTTQPSDINMFIRADGYLNATIYVFDTNWTTVRSYTDLLAVYVYSSSPDTIPPVRIINLDPSDRTATSITLTWTATGDELWYGTATGYELKYSKSGPITNASWDSSITFPQSWAPLPSGSLEIHIVSGLESGTQYWFAIKAYDEVLNNSTISNTVSASTVDITPPAAITDLVAVNATANSIILSWTAPGDDANNETVSGYVAKYSTTGPITDQNWDSAVTYSQSWTPLQADNNETQTVYGLSSNTQYWFAVRAFDETPNYGAASNSPTATTENGGNQSPLNLALIILPVGLGGLAVGALGIRIAMTRSKQTQKSPFKRRTELPEPVSKPKLREYVGEGGVVPQPPKKAKFEEKEENISRQEGAGESSK
jgi:hypothetical protein